MKERIALTEESHVEDCPVKRVNVVSKEFSSSIASHINSSSQCLQKYSDTCFTVLSRARSFSHLKVLEAVYISTTKPVLCIQKEFVVTLKLLIKS